MLLRGRAESTVEKIREVAEFRAGDESWTIDVEIASARSALLRAAFHFKREQGAEMVFRDDSMAPQVAQALANYLRLDSTSISKLFLAETDCSSVIKTQTKQPMCKCQQLHVRRNNNTSDGGMARNPCWFNIGQVGPSAHQ